MDERRGVVRKVTQSLAFVNGIPLYRTAHSARKSLLQQLKSTYHCTKIRVDHNSAGHARGWAWVGFKSDEDRDKCCREMNGKLFIPQEESSQKCYVTISPCTNTKLCQAFPSATHEQRLQLILDSEGYYSITDEYTADHITIASLDILSVVQSIHHLVIDCTAGCGGNTASFIRSQRFSQVISYEQHEERAQHLHHNMSIFFPDLKNWTIRGQNFLLFLQNLRAGSDENCASTDVDFMFLDPPWGGQNYRHGMVPSTEESTPSGPGDYILGDISSLTIQLSELLSETIPFQLNQACAIPSINSVKLVGVKLPEIFDLTRLCDQITKSDPRWEQEDMNGDIIHSSNPNTCSSKRKKSILDSRPHPFRLQLGTRTILLLVAYPPFFRNTHLDSIVESLVAFDRVRGFEFHPRFYDWEKRKWISLHSWKGCKMTPVNAEEAPKI